VGRFTDWFQQRGHDNPYTAVIARHLDTVEASRDRGGRILGGSVGEIPAFVKDGVVDVGLGTYAGVPGELLGQLGRDLAFTGNAEIESIVNPRSTQSRAYGAGGIDAYERSLPGQIRPIIGAQGVVLSAAPDLLLGQGRGTARRASKLKIPTEIAAKVAAAAPTPQQAAQVVPSPTAAAEVLEQVAAKADDAPDLSLGNLNERLNASPVALPGEAVPPKVSRNLAQLRDKAYGDKARFAFPALLKRLGAKVEPDGRITREGEDISDKVYAFLEQRPGLKPKEADRALGALADEVKKPLQLPQGGDIAAGGGGMGIVSPTARMLATNPEVLTTAIGATTGALAGGLADEDGGADGYLAGALAGGAAGYGAGKLPGRTIKDTLGVMGQEAKKGWVDAWQNGGFSLKSLGQDWRDDKTKNLRGLGIDEVSNRVRALINGIPQADINGTYRSLLDRRKQAGTFVPYDDEMEEMLRLSYGPDFDPAKLDWSRMLGQGYMAGAGGEGTKPLHPLAAAVAGGGYSLAGVGALVPALAVPVGAARGFARAATATGYQAANDLAHYAVRGTAYKREARALLEQAHAAFAGSLRGAGMDPALLSRSDGLYTASEVAQKYGDEAGAAWKAIQDQIYGVPAVKGKAATKKNPAVDKADQMRGLAGDFVVNAFGDYSDPTFAHKAFDFIAPFSRYAVGQAKPLAQMAASHPGAALALAHWIQTDQKRAQAEGRPGYQVGTIRVDTETPGVGRLVRAQLGGAEGEGRINPLSSVMSVSGSNVGATDKFEEADTPYKWAEAVLNALGFSFNPLIAAGAYVVGGQFGTDRAPGAQSRTANIEAALPGPQMPGLRGVLDQARQAMGNDPDTYDPVELLAKEIIFQRSKKPASDPSNAHYAKALADPNSELMQEAKRRHLSGGVVKNVVSLNSPVTMQTSTDEKVAYRQAQVDQEGAEKKTGAAAIYKDPKGTKYKANGKKVDPRLTEWEKKNSTLRRVAPKAYAKKKYEFMEANGIKD
jgi:hypothetical protein